MVAPVAWDSMLAIVWREAVAAAGKAEEEAGEAEEEVGEEREEKKTSVYGRQLR